MAQRSQNGYYANDISLTDSYDVPGGRLRLREGNVATVLVYVANFFHENVEPLKWPGVWGYAERKVRGGSSLSNHASGTAIDLNAPAHWLGEEGTFSYTQLRKIRELLNFLEGTVRWGGDYSGRKDEMHFEIDKAPSAVARVARKIEAAKAGEIKKPDVVDPGRLVRNIGYDFPYPSDHWFYQPTSNEPRCHSGYYSAEEREHIYRWVKALRAHGHGVTQTSKYHAYVEHHVKRFQHNKGLKADGVVGPVTWNAIDNPRYVK